MLPKWLQEDFEGFWWCWTTRGFVLWMARETRYSILGTSKLTKNFETYFQVLTKTTSKTFSRGLKTSWYDVETSCFFFFFLDIFLYFYCVGDLSEKEYNAQNLGQSMYIKKAPPNWPKFSTLFLRRSLRDPENQLW